MKKKLICFFIFFIIIIVVFVSCIFIKTSYISNKSKTNKETASKLNNEFELNEIYFYSTASAVSNTTNYQNPEWNLKVYQYTDLAIYLDRLNEPDDDNYITLVKASNFKLAKKDKQEIYYINPTLMGKTVLDLDSKIENDLEYTVINSENKENTQGYNIPVFFQDCSNPITLRFVNYLADNYKVSSDNQLIYNGGLIRELGLKLDNLKSSFSFDLQIETKNGEKRVKEINIDIPLKKGSKSILDGDFEIREKYDIRF